MSATTAAATDGALRFARYAYPPNVLGYCGTAAHRELLERVDASAVDPGLTQLARGFHGAWPYLELLAGASGGQPLDADVVEAYWIGGDLLDRVGMAEMGLSVESRFKRRAGLGWRHLEAGIPAGGVPHHSFHVFCVYPWVGLLRSAATDHARDVLDRCRIRTGIVDHVDGTTAIVRSRPLVWDGRQLAIGAPVAETVTVASDGYRLVAVEPGDIVALHWDWVCDRLDRRQAARVERLNARHLAMANVQLSRSFADDLGEPVDARSAVEELGSAEATGPDGGGA